MEQLRVDYRGGMRFEIKARSHIMTVDLPKEKGGEDSGMHPPEVFMASLGSCIGVYIARYCQNAKLDSEGMSVGLEWSLSDDKTKISDIEVHIALPKADIGKRKNVVLEVARHCLIHNTILGQPQIRISLEGT